MRSATFLFVLAVSSAAFAAELTETFSRTLDVRPGTSFEIENVNGSITISGWDQPRVRIHAVKRVKSRDSAAAQQAMKALRVEVRQSSGSVVVDTIYPKRSDLGMFDRLFGSDSVNAGVKYEINVPRAMNLSVDTVNGTIRVTEVSGEIDLDTTNGKIEVANCSGSVDASTTNGAIAVELVSVAPGRNMKFETTNGRITLAVPAGLAADINASTTNGSVQSDLPLTLGRMSRTSIRGTLNGGGPEIKLRTTNGGIDIRASGAVASRS
ncbi:MAG TPA: DUF4097 family beta strand repeat-containing protein [Thermoanaerobaculia bacterium]|nr:DUF4097 family beta strand repeat-containing protein [Thermoanaerobaculia bacterium]